MPRINVDTDRLMEFVDTTNSPLKHDQNKAIALLLTERNGKKDTGALIAETLGVTRATVNRWRRSPEFQAEFKRQMDLWRRNFDDVPLADRKERVLCLSELFQDLDKKQVQLKIKVLTAIRQEVGDDKQVVEVTHTGEVGLRLPPRAETYEEWQAQNAQMVAVEEAS